MEAGPSAARSLQDLHGWVQGSIPHVSGQISQGIQEGNEALRNSTGFGSWVVFLTYFCLGS